MKSSLPSIAVAAVFFFPVQLAAAAPYEPPPIPAIASARSTLRNPPRSATLLLDSVSIRLEETTLRSVIGRVGVGRVKRKGDAGESTAWLCYSLPYGLRLWLVSGELGRRDDVVTGWHVTERRDTGNIDCPELLVDLHLAAPSLRHIWIGTSASELKTSLQTPSATGAGWRVYSYSGRAVKEGLEQLTIFGARVRDGRVDQLFASQATTN